MPDRAASSETFAMRASERDCLSMLSELSVDVSHVGVPELQQGVDGMWSWWFSLMRISYAYACKGAGAP